MAGLAKKLVASLKTHSSPKVPQFILELLKQLGDLQASSPSSSPNFLSLSLEAMAPTLPFLYQLFTKEGSKFLPGALFDLMGIAGHSGHSTADLTSLYSPKCNQQGLNCGPYLHPLTHSDGASYTPNHASSYLSRVLYLADDIASGLQGMVERFRGLKCTCNAAGCHSSTSSNSACSCKSVVECGGILPLLYDNGFNFQHAILLKGMKWMDAKKTIYKQENNTIRTCNKFQSQLTKVIKPESPLDKLITPLDAFLYAIRWEFFSKLYAFWTIYICLILYTLFFLLDTLRIRSHLKLGTSHTVPPLALLTSGKSLPVTKLTYIGQ